MSLDERLDGEPEMSIAAILRQDLRELDRVKYSLFHRLRSIREDALFVSEICRNEYPGLPIVPNQRCGAWYLNPAKVDLEHPVYFKSTDGHFGRWDFNLRRANLHLLPFIEAHQGVVIVDSTRRGKRLPDALSKTLPIWCCVINRALERKLPRGWDLSLFTPPAAVSRSEHSQIELLVDAWVDKLQSSSFDLEKLAKPLRPIWVTRSSDCGAHLPLGELDFYPVVCISASEQVIDGIGRRHGYHYVQGSGDDHESWSEGLTPQIYWAHEEELYNCPSERIHDLVRDVLTRRSSIENATMRFIPITATYSLVELGRGNDGFDAKEMRHATILITGQDDNVTSTGEVDEGPLGVRCTIPSGKKAGQVAFMQSLSRVSQFAEAHFRLHENVPIRVASLIGEDALIGIAMTILQRFFDDEGRLIRDGHYQVVSKQSIRRRLEWIQQSWPGANPSRITMNRVNEYFMTPNGWRRSRTDNTS